MATLCYDLERREPACLQLLTYTASRCLATVLRRDAGVCMLCSGVLVVRVPATALPRTLSDTATTSRDTRCPLLLTHDAYARSDKLKLRRLDRTFLWSRCYCNHWHSGRRAQLPRPALGRPRARLP